MVKKLILSALFSAYSSILYSATLPTGDTQGKIAAVVVDHNHARDYNSFRIWLENTENDRFNCIQENGYVTVRSNGVGVDDVNFQQIFSIALAAQASSRTISLAHSGTDACINVNGAWMLN
jgi:riboflavin synthase alpha subunit